MNKTPGPPMNEAMFTKVMNESIRLNVSMEEICRRALENYFFVKEEARKGNKVQVVDSKGEKIRDIVYQI